MEGRSLKGHVSLRELSAIVSQLSKENQSLKAKLAAQERLTEEDKKNANDEIAWLELEIFANEEIMFEDQNDSDNKIKALQALISTQAQEHQEELAEAEEKKALAQLTSADSILSIAENALYAEQEMRELIEELHITKKDTQRSEEGSLNIPASLWAKSRNNPGLEKALITASVARDLEVLRNRIFKFRT